MKIDGVFSGGGVKAFAYIGVLDSLQENNLQLERVAGTSAGAIIASLVAAGFELEEIQGLVEKLRLTQFVDPPIVTKYLPFTKWLFLYTMLGINKGDKMEEWLTIQLASKNIHTFHDIKPGYLKVVVSDLSLGKLIVIPDDLEKVYGIQPEYFPVAKAVRMSAGFPFFFMPKKLPGLYKKKSVMVDGGLLSNFPLWIFDNESEKKQRPLLGVKLTDGINEDIGPRDIKNALDMFQALFSTMKQAHDSRYIAKNQMQNIMIVPVKDTESTDFGISNEKKAALIQSGKDYAAAFLKHWST
ncbi:patatin-like phospholipase family protein [Oceanobacillus massiliensis]|uniref:patatin-like phospholipase family protein n=1 Tax=Oceanobacillus massiliensis TaxID=1465765 RepID=UPI000288C9A6|nr:patatin-like phospholipase family protein [Oceanobacillus massiliensis]